MVLLCREEVGMRVCPAHLLDDEELLSKSACLACHPQLCAHATHTTMMVARTNTMAMPTTPTVTPAIVRVMSAEGGEVGRTGREQRAHNTPLQTKHPSTQK